MRPDDEQRQRPRGLLPLSCADLSPESPQPHQRAVLRGLPTAPDEAWCVVRCLLACATQRRLGLRVRQCQVTRLDRMQSLRVPAPHGGAHRTLDAHLSVVSACLRAEEDRRQQRTLLLAGVSLR